jgi:hypothetical protein
MTFRIVDVCVICVVAVPLLCGCYALKDDSTSPVNVLASRKAYGYRILKELREAGSIELCAFDLSAAREDIATPGTLRGWKILTHAIVTGQEQRQVIEVLLRGIEIHDGRVATEVDKERGIRAITSTGDIIEIEISFFSYQVIVTRNGRFDGVFTVAESIQDEFDAIIVRNGQNVGDPMPIPHPAAAIWKPNREWWAT